MNKRCKTAIGHTLHVLGLSDSASSTMRLAELSTRASLEEAIALFEIIADRGTGIVQDSARDTLKMLRWELDETARKRNLRRCAEMLANRKVGETVGIYEGGTRVGDGEIIEINPSEFRVSTMYSHTLPTLIFDRFGRGISDFRLSIKIY